MSGKVLFQVLPHTVLYDSVIALNEGFGWLIRLGVYEHPQSDSFPTLGRTRHRALSYAKVNSEPAASVHVGLGPGILLQERPSIRMLTRDGCIVLVGDSVVVKLLRPRGAGDRRSPAR